VTPEQLRAEAALNRRRYCWCVSTFHFAQAQKYRAAADALDAQLRALGDNPFRYQVGMAALAGKAS
jgi:hypothetical protein